MSLTAGSKDFQKLFDPKAYLEMYFHLDECRRFFLKHLAHLFISGKPCATKEYIEGLLPENCTHVNKPGTPRKPEGNPVQPKNSLRDYFQKGLVKGKTLIEIGTGPSIYSLLSACEAFEDIIVSDFTDCNLEAFKDWLLERPGAFDWSRIVKIVCHLEGDRTTWKEKEARLRKSIKQVLKCDVLKSPPIEGAVPQADCILSSLCLESACKDHKDYVAALHHMISLLKPGGYLVLTGVIGGSYYNVGGVRFSCCTLTEPFIREALAGAGFTIVKVELSAKTEESLEDIADFSAYYFLVAQKNE